MSDSRIVQTSRGWLEIGMLNMRWPGFMVSVKRYDEDGWLVEEKGQWYANRSDESLAQFLSSFAQLPEPEASELASHVQGPWRETWLASGGAEETPKLERVALGSIIGLVAVALLALMGVAFIVWLVVE
jgi:hypothetical protein